MKPKRHRTKQLKHLVSNDNFDYFVSKTGYVVRYSRITGHKNIYEGYLDSYTGYVVVSILGKKYRMHRIVAEAWIPNPNNLETIDHINGDKTNNHISNLRWMTRADNTKATPKKFHKAGNAPKPIKVNGKQYASISEAARFIQFDSGRGSYFSIRKELRRFLQGKRPSWRMYGKYDIKI